MTLLLLGLAIFIGMHSVRIVADDFRTRSIARLGPNGWKAIYAIVSIIGFVLLVKGYGAARAEAVVLWSPPSWTRHIAALLAVVGFVFIAAAYVPGTRIKAAVGHPMVIGVKTWALGHLLANGTLADVVLFGVFLAWAVASYRAARQRDRAAAPRLGTGSFARDAVAVIGGVALAGLFALHLHALWIGVRPF